MEPIRIERAVALPAPVDEVWAELTDPDRIAGWFGARVEIELRPGGRVVVREADGSERLGVVEAVEPGRRLAFRWAPFSRSPDGAPELRTPGRVEFQLEASGEGTRLSVTEVRHEGTGAGTSGLPELRAAVVA